MDQNTREQEVGRVFQWFAENPGLVEQIRCEDGIVDTKQAIELLEKLHADRMEYMIPILLANMYPDRTMNKVIKQFAVETIQKALSSDGLDATVERLISIAKNELAKQ